MSKEIKVIKQEYNLLSKRFNNFVKKCKFFKPSKNYHNGGCCLHPVNQGGMMTSDDTCILNNCPRILYD